MSGGFRNAVVLSVYFCNENSGWASGSGGLIVKTTNGGKNWSRINTGVTSDLYSINFPSMTTGWAVGNKDFHNTGRMILKTTNGGSTWFEQSIGGASKWLYSACFADTTTGWACGNEGLILRTTHGESWTTQATPTGNALYSICFPTRFTGYAAGNGGVIIKSTDGGTSWFSQAHPIVSSLGSIYFLDSLNGWAAGSVILKTTNGGTDWIKLCENYLYYINSVYFFNSLAGWAAGTNSFGTAGIILYTSNGGTSWDEVLLGNNTNSSSGLQHIKFYGNNFGWAAGSNGAILHTTDGRVVNVNEKPVMKPNGYMLYDNYPNPFNPSTTIKYNLLNSGIVSVRIYNVLGEEIKTLVNGYNEAGLHNVVFDAGGLPSGIYFYRINAGQYNEIKKMVLIK
jgi:photosystem II stability/assembly factor-like uncharacterized protein